MSTETLKIDARLTYPDFRLAVSQSLHLSGYSAIFGPSGSGKSTLLRLIAGFERPDDGAITFGETIWTDTQRNIDIPPHRRRVGMVFQDGRLLPHLSVEKNLHYADHRARHDPSDFDYGEIVNAFDLKSLLGRAPGSLSGGERQRVALARTILTRPVLLLLDEPLSALDQHRKAEIIPYLENLPTRFGMPAIYVSHNIEEIMQLADQTVLLKAGEILASGATADVLNAYDLHQFDDQLHAGSIVKGTVIDHVARHHLTLIETGDGIISVPMNAHKLAGQSVYIRIDARNVAVSLSAPEALSIRNVIPATVVDISEDQNSPFSTILLNGKKMRLRAQITKAAVEELNLKPGQPVFALIKTASFEN